jgi:hypothetical protein
MVMKGHMPRPIAVVSSNLPCDGGMSSYAMIESEMKVPVFRADIPFDFRSERAVAYFAGELRRMIAWLEEHTPGRMDWDRMRAVCEERNRAVEYEMELWDMLRARPAPMAADPIVLSHMLFYQVLPASSLATALYRDILALAKQIRAEGGQALANERFRTVNWCSPALHFPGLFSWAEKAYGVAVLQDMLSFNRHPSIDTSSPDTMLAGLARIVLEGPMARHTRGYAENYYTDLFHLYRHYDLDMIWIVGHIGCKSAQALTGMVREKCREQSIPLLVIDFDLSDSRICPDEGIKRQISRFMESVMKA